MASGLPMRINSAARSAHSRLSAWPIAPVAPTTATVQSASAKPYFAQAASTERMAVQVVRLLPLVIVSPGRCASARPPSATIELKPSQSDHAGAALAGQIDRALHERNRGVAREGEKLRRQMRQHDELTIGNTAVRGLDSELIKWKRFDKFGDARPQPVQLLVAEWLQR